MAAIPWKIFGPHQHRPDEQPNVEQRRQHMHGLVGEEDHRDHLATDVDGCQEQQQAITPTGLLSIFVAEEQQTDAEESVGTGE
ncbi:hypothetical protein [Dyella sp. ASV21]|uniref:hypothetical protein n=1 Tax=Dyella sp. ASV21 TaxID=2795114 RepID=UPI001E5D7ACD|nr:hypothetical protein [Dyella sp. ASV21]